MGAFLGSVGDSHILKINSSMFSYLFQYTVSQFSGQYHSVSHSPTRLTYSFRKSYPFVKSFSSTINLSVLWR